MKSLTSALLICAALAPDLSHAQIVPRAEPIVYAEPSEDIYVALIVASAGWAKKSVSKSLGILHRDDAGPGWQRATEAATKQHGLKPIPLEDYGVYCVTRQPTRSAGYSRSCNMKGAEAVLQFNMVKVMGDTGLVVTSVTRVPKNSTRPETEHHCVTLFKTDTVWTVLGSKPVVEPARCSGG